MSLHTMTSATIARSSFSGSRAGVCWHHVLHLSCLRDCKISGVEFSMCWCCVPWLMAGLQEHDNSCISEGCHGGALYNSLVHSTILTHCLFSGSDATVCPHLFSLLHNALWSSWCCCLHRVQEHHLFYVFQGNGLHVYCERTENMLEAKLCNFDSSLVHTKPLSFARINPPRWRVVLSCDRYKVPLCVHRRLFRLMVNQLSSFMAHEHGLNNATSRQQR